MAALTDYRWRRRNVLLDNRLVYGVDHYDYNGITYHGVISEDGTNRFEKIHPFGMSRLATPLQELEDAQERQISKIYFDGHDKTSGSKTLGIVKTNEGIRIVRNQMHYDANAEFRKRIGYQQVGEDKFPSMADGTITVEEIQNAIKILRQNNPEDKFIEAICAELEMFIERKVERKQESETEFLVSDICRPNITVHFDTEVIINMIIKQGVDKSISNILRAYSEKFRNDKQSVINSNGKYCRREQYKNAEM